MLLVKPQSVSTVLDDVLEIVKDSLWRLTRNSLQAQAGRDRYDNPNHWFQCRDCRI